MSERIYCNICGNEMWEQNGKYHCELCERPDVFRRITICICWKEKDGKVCGRPVVEIPQGWWGSRKLPGRRTNAGHGITMCRHCNETDVYYKKEKEFRSIAHYFAWGIITGTLTYDELRFDWPEPFIHRVEELVDNWDNE